jgi:hypothetical protein
MPRGGARQGAGRPKRGQSKGPTLKEELAEIKNTLPAIIPPKRLVDADDKDAAAQADDIMQHAGREMRKARALMDEPAEGACVAALRDDYLQWANVVLRVASLLLPYQRPTYRSIEVRTDRGLEEQRTRYVGDPAERLAQIVVGAILAQPDAVAPQPVKTEAEAVNNHAEAGTAPAPAVDNGDGVIS